MKAKLIVMTLLLSFAIGGCGSSDKHKPNYRVGDLVIAVVESKEGQITRIHCYTHKCMYYINFWGAEGFAEDFMNEFEFHRK